MGFLGIFWEVPSALFLTCLFENELSTKDSWVPSQVEAIRRTPGSAATVATSKFVQSLSFISKPARIDFYWQFARFDEMAKGTWNIEKIVINQAI